MWIRERYQWDQGAARWYKVSTTKAPSVVVTPEHPGGVAASPPWLPAGAVAEAVEPWVGEAKNPPYRCAVTYRLMYEVVLTVGKPVTRININRESWRIALSWHGAVWEGPGGDAGALDDASPVRQPMPGAFGNASPFSSGGQGPDDGLGLAMPLAVGLGAFALWRFLK